MRIRKNIVIRSHITLAIVVLLSGTIVFRIMKIQQIEGSHWKKYGDDNRLQVKDIKAVRGNIYAEDGSVLATSIPFYRLAFDPYIASDKIFNQGIDSLSYMLSKYYKNLSPYQYKQKIINARKKKKRYMLLNRKEIDFQTKKQMEKWSIFREGRLRGGILFEKREKRFLPFSHLGYRTVGNLNEKHLGKVGLEYSFNKELAGKNGSGLFQRLTDGGWIPINEGEKKHPVHGYDIQTTLNINILGITESALLKTLQKHDADYGVAVVMDVPTGEIKAISNLAKDPQGKYYELYNYAVGSQGAREPGSTFKLASMIALLEETNIKLSDIVDTGNGELTFYDMTMKDHKPGGFGTLTVQEVFEKSSNIGVAKLITKYFGDNPKKFIQYLKKMELHRPTGFQMVGEGLPYLKDPSDTTWSGVSLAWMSHGYELKMTPLQMLVLYNAIANNGRMMKPMIVKKVLKEDKTIQEFEPKVINKKVCSDNTLKKIKTMMEGVVKRGTASNINYGSYGIAGKTGTAKRARNGRYVKEYYTSFVGYFPAESPRFSCIIVIDNPKGYQIYGSDVSAPVFKEIADKIFSMYPDLNPIEYETVITKKEIFPLIQAGKQDELAFICNSLNISNKSNINKEWVRAQTKKNTVFWDNAQVDSKHIPDVRGMTIKDALHILENLGLSVQVYGIGRIKTQSMQPGWNIAKGSIIILKAHS